MQKRDYMSKTVLSLRKYCEIENLPEIIKQFDEKKNDPANVDNIFPKSSKKFWFSYMECGHSKKQRVSDKTSKRSIACPICQNRGGIGKSLFSEFPDSYAKMFNEERNHISTQYVSYRSGEIYWWKCLICGQDFRGRIATVTSGKRVCPNCSNKKRSDAEKILSYYIQMIDANRVVDFRLDGWKYDLYLPKYNLIIEYDGYPWHNMEKSMKNDANKDFVARANGYKICRLRDERLKSNDMLTADIWTFKYDYSHKYFSGFSEFLSKYIGDDAYEMKIDVPRDNVKIHNLNLKECMNKSLLVEKPELRDYIDNADERNGDVEYVFAKSSKIRVFMRHPLYTDLKWSYTAKDLFSKKGEPIPQAIKMCTKLIRMYPDLYKTVCEIGMGMHENTVIEKECDRCGMKMEFRYTQLYYSKYGYKMCRNCLKNYRKSNLRKKNN